MNSVQLCGKIIKIVPFEKVTYVTLLCKDAKNTEYLDITVFDTTFLNRYFKTGMWMGVSAHIHKNKNKNYQQEIIAEQFFFVGDAPDPEEEYYNINEQQANELAKELGFTSNQPSIAV